jgi:anti-sigma regulatory factor (Ser/Thr protein kinase)
MRDRARMSRLRLHLSATAEEVPFARAAITRLCEHLEIDEKLTERVRLAVTEACTNCVRHAYGELQDSANYVLDGRDLMSESYAVRREALEHLHLKRGRWLTTPSLRNEAGAGLYGFTLEQSWEGVVAKRLDAPYRPAARNGAWLKAKHSHARDLQDDRSTWSARERRAVDEPLITYR